MNSNYRSAVGRPQLMARRVGHFKIGRPTHSTPIPDAGGGRCGQTTYCVREDARCIFRTRQSGRGYDRPMRSIQRSALAIHRYRQYAFGQRLDSALSLSLSLFLPFPLFFCVPSNDVVPYYVVPPFRARGHHRRGDCLVRVVDKVS